MARLLVIMFQKYIGSASLPDDWRATRVVLVIKEGSSFQIDNYCLISLISSSCKMLVHILAKCINNLLMQENILTGTQYGFWHKHLTTI